MQYLNNPLYKVTNSEIGYLNINANNFIFAKFKDDSYLTIK